MTDGVSGVESRARAEDVSPSGNSTIDGLLHGNRWVSDTNSATTTLSFSFPDENSLFSEDPDLGYDTSGNEPHTGLSELSAYGQELFLSAIDNLESFTNLDFVQVADSGSSAGTIRVAYTGLEDEDSVAWAYLPGAYQAAGDIWVLSENHTEDDIDFQQTLFHELGHALGLKHPFEAEGAFGVLDSSLDGIDMTVMSYEISARHPEAQWADLFPQSYMYADILALQYLYGVDTETTAGNDMYVFDLSGRHFVTIWDYGGTDTINITGGSRAVKIDLTPGSWSNVGTTIEYWDGQEYWDETDSLFIAPDTIIENASGAGGNDTLLGNDVSNRLEGNAGTDKLAGGAGADVLVGGVGSDVSAGGAGNDQIWAGGGDQGDDVVAGGAGADVMGGGAGNDFLIGGAVDDGANMHFFLTNEAQADDGSDTLFGGDGDDTLLGGGWDDGAVADNGAYNDGEAIRSGTSSDYIWAGTGNDLIVASDGDDQLGGGTGDDTIRGGGGDDAIYGGNDSGDTGLNDVLSGGGGDDEIFGAQGNDSINGDAGDDNLFSGAGTDTVDGGAGDDTLWGGGGDDIFTGGSGADLFVFSANHGDDTVTDYDIEEDMLDLREATTAFADAASVASAAVTISGGVLIDLGGGDTLTLEGVSLEDLQGIILFAV
jgi:serralysin